MAVQAKGGLVEMSHRMSPCMNDFGHDKVLLKVPENQTAAVFRSEDVKRRLKHCRALLNA